MIVAAVVWCPPRPPRQSVVVTVCVRVRVRVTVVALICVGRGVHWPGVCVEVGLQVERECVVCVGAAQVWVGREGWEGDQLWTVWVCVGCCCSEKVSESHRGETRGRGLADTTTASAATARRESLEGIACGGR